MDKKNIIIVVVVAVVFAGGGFFGGMKYAQGKGAAAQQQRIAGARNGAGFAGRGAGGANGAGFVNGQIISKDATSITVKTTTGTTTGSKIILLAGSTTIGKTTSGAVSDLAVGQDVVVNGSNNSDGSVTAQNIQIRPVTPSGSTPSGQ